MNPEKVRGLKRFKSVVMDGKVIGALRELPECNSHVETLVGVKGQLSKLLSNRKKRDALKHVITSVHRAIRAVEYGRNSEVLQNLSSVDGTVYFRLGSMLGQKGMSRNKYEDVMKLGRWYCGTRSFMCPGSKWSASNCQSNPGCKVEKKWKRSLAVLSQLG